MKPGKKVISKKPGIPVAKVPVVIENNLKNLFYSFLVIFILHFLINWFFQEKNSNVVFARSWGINNFSYYSIVIQITFYSVLILLAFPVVNEKIFLIYNKTNSFSENGIINRNYFRLIIFFFFSVLIAYLFYLFKVKYDLLGDMNLRIIQTLKQEYVKEEYLTMYMLYQLYEYLYNHFHLNGHQVFVLQSVFTGFLFCFFSFLTADLLMKKLNSKILFFLFYISMGTALLFCGYVEIYSMPALIALIYLYFSLLFLKGKIKITAVFIVLMLAIFFHKLLICFIPSFLFLFFKKINKADNIRTRHIILFSVISIFLIYLINSQFSFARLTPLMQSHSKTNSITLFSFSHLYEFLNSQLLSSGLSLFLLIFILIKSYRRKIKPDDISKFLLTAYMFMLVVVFTTDKMRGSGDWDICSFPSIPLNLFVIYAAINHFGQIYSRRKIFYLLSVIGIFNFINAVTWIEINSGNKSTKKVSDMLIGDPASYYKTLPAEMGLARNFELHGLKGEALLWHEAGYKKYSYKNPNASFNYAIALESRKREDEAILIYENTVQTFPYFINSYQRLFLIYEKRKEYNNSFKLSKSMVTAYDQNPDAMIKAAGKDFLLNIFSYVYQVSLSQRDFETSKSMEEKINRIKSI